MQETDAAYRCRSKLLEARVLAQHHKLTLVGLLVPLISCVAAKEATDPGTVPNGGGPNASTPGYAWKALNGTPPRNLRGLAYGANKWVAVGTGVRSVSSDGIAWQTTTLSPGTFSAGDVAFGNGKFIAVNGRDVLTTTDGLTWSTQTLANATGLEAIAYGGGKWVAADDRFISNDVVALWVSSNDGATWQQALTSIPYAQPSAIAYGNGMFVIVGYGGLVATSTDGATWAKRSFGTTSLGVTGVAYGNNMFVAVTNGGSAYRSSDGISWTRAAAAPTLMSVTFGSGLFIAVDYGIYTSPDAVTWTSRSEAVPNGAEFYAIAYGVNQFAAVGTHFIHSP